MLEDDVSRVLQEILRKKSDMEKVGKSPRLILVDNCTFEMLEQDWIGCARDLPWGDSLVYEMEMRRKRGGKMFLGDGTLFDLWVVRVDTVDGFEIF